MPALVCRKKGTYAIFRFQFRPLLCCLFDLSHKHIEKVLRVLVVLLVRQRCRVRDMRRCAGDRLRLGRWRIRRFGIDAFPGSGGRVESLTEASRLAFCLRLLVLEGSGGGSGGSWCPADAERWTEGGEDCSRGTGEHAGLIFLLFRIEDGKIGRNWDCWTAWEEERKRRGRRGAGGIMSLRITS